MHCIILAAGRGTRMGELCDDCPKPMLLIKGKPKLAHSIEMLPEEVTEVVLMVGYRKEKIIDFFRDEYAGRKIQYIIHDAIDGTGKILHDVKDIVEERFLVTMGDDLYRREDLQKLLSVPLGVLAMERVDANRYAVLETDESGNLVAITETPHASSSRLVNTGAYALTRAYFSYPLVPKSLGSAEYGLPQTLMRMRDKNAIAVARASDWLPIGTPEELESAQTRIIDFF